MSGIDHGLRKCFIEKRLSPIPFPIRSTRHYPTFPPLKSMTLPEDVQICLESTKAPEAARTVVVGRSDVQDRIKPLCTRCITAGLSCGGYAEDFRNSFSSIEQASFGIDALKGGNSASLVQGVEKQSTTTRASRITKPWTIYIPPSLSLGGFRNDVYVSYTIAKVFRGATKISRVLTLPTSRFLEEGTLTKDALIAFSMVYYARQHRDDRTKNLAMSLYGRCLHRLQNIINNSTDLKDLPEAVAILVIFELLSGETGRQWVSHMLGLEKIYRLLGSQAVSENEALLSLFEAIRPLAIGARIYVRQASHFASQHWNVIPWCRRHKSITQQLLDIWTQIPGLSADTYIAVDKNDLVAANQISFRSRQIYDALQNWYAAYQKIHVVHHVEPKWQPRGWNQGIPWDTVLSFDHTEAAADYLSFCTASNLVLRATVAADKLSLNLGSPHKLADVIWTTSTQICRSVEYMIGDTRRGAGAFYLIFPMSCAWQSLPNDTLEGSWLREAILEIHGSRMDGWGSMNGLLSRLRSGGKWV